METKKSLFSRLPIVSHLKKSMGLQRGMLIAGAAMTAAFLLTAALAPLIAPYGATQRFDETQAPPSSVHLWGTTAGGYDVFSAPSGGPRPQSW